MFLNVVFKGVVENLVYINKKINVHPDKLVSTCSRMCKRWTALVPVPADVKAFFPAVTYSFPETDWTGPWNRLASHFACRLPVITCRLAPIRVETVSGGSYTFGQKKLSVYCVRF